MSKIPGAAYVLDDVATDPAVENQEADPRITPARAIHVNLRDVSGAEINDVNPLALSDQFSEFWRIKTRRFADAEEVRYDIPATLVSQSIYTGLAPTGTATSAAAWTIIRTQFDGNGNPNRERIRFAMTWDGRAAGWP